MDLFVIPLFVAFCVGFSAGVATILLVAAYLRGAR